MPKEIAEWECRGTGYYNSYYDYLGDYPMYSGNAHSFSREVQDAIQDSIADLDFVKPIKPMIEV